MIFPRMNNLKSTIQKANEFFNKIRKFSLEKKITYSARARINFEVLNDPPVIFSFDIAELIAEKILGKIQPLISTNQ